MQKRKGHNFAVILYENRFIYFTTLKFNEDLI